jgi:hypothetical protein
MRTKKIAFPFLFLIVLSIFSSMLIAAAQSSTLTVTVATDKQTTYDKYDPITISGAVQYGDISPASALVAIEVDFPSGGGPMVLRTVQTGSGTVTGLPEQISAAYPTSGLGGSQIGTVQNGELGYFSVTVTDKDSQPHNNMLLAIAIFDGNGVPLGLSTSTLSLGAGGTQTSSVGIPIPTTAHSGPAYGYADLYTALPSSNGVPLAQETQFQFTVSGGTPSSGPAPSTSSATAGAYSLTFKLPKQCPDGAYKVYATATWAGQSTTTPSTTGFNVLLIGDFDFAGVVNGNDLFIFAAAYINYYQGLGITNSLCDINGDGKIDATDFFLFVSAYIQYWSP